jgi:hypothetical protein
LVRLFAVCFGRSEVYVVARSSLVTSDTLCSSGTVTDSDSSKSSLREMFAASFLPRSISFLMAIRA